MPNIYDVAKLAGVALATVSRVINAKDIVKDKTRERVLSAMKTLNYVPNASRKKETLVTVIIFFTVRLIPGDILETVWLNKTHC